METSFPSWRPRWGSVPIRSRKASAPCSRPSKRSCPPGFFPRSSRPSPAPNRMLSDAQAAPETSGGGLVSSITGAVGKLFGGSGAAAAAAKLTHLGFSADQVKTFLASVVEYLKGKLPGDAMKQVGALLPTG